MKANTSLSPAKLLLTIAIIIVGLLAGAGLPFGVIFVGYAFGSAFIIWLIAGHPTLREALLAIVGSLLIAYVNYLGIGPARPLKVDHVIGFLGLATMIVLGIKAVWSDETEREELKRILMPSLAMAFLVLASQNLLAIPSLMSSKTFDLYAFAADGSFGFQPSFLMGQIYLHHPLVTQLGSITYFGLPIAMAIVYGLHLKYRVSSQWYVIELLFAGGLLGYLLYNVFPATGPIYVFSNIFPDQPLPLDVLRHVRLELIPASRTAARNAMPSLHMAWALLLWFCCWPLPKVARWGSFAYVLVTIIDTLGSGEHYFVDLLVAVPFSVAVVALCATDMNFTGRRGRAFAVESLLTATWLVVLREWPHVFLTSVAIPWAAAVISTAASLAVVPDVLREQYRRASDHLSAASASGCDLTKAPLHSLSGGEHQQ